MTDGTLLEQIRKLVELQNIDAEIYSFNKELDEKPAYLADLLEQFEGKKAKLNSLEEKFKETQLKRKSLEGELKDKEEMIAKANAQLSQIKTNKEYTAKVTEIEALKAGNSDIEEKILLSYDEGDEVKVEIEKEKQELAKEEEKYNKAKKEIEDLIKEIKDKIKVLESRRAQVVPNIDKKDLARYEKILHAKDGLAIVPISGSVCSGCFMNVPAQVINEIKMHKSLVYCEMCARILYISDEL